MSEFELDRREVLAKLLPDHGEYLLVSGLAGSSKDAAELTDDGDNIFTMAGAMGAAVSIGLGIALSAPKERVAVITGDGELMMGIGSLATVATMMPNNLSIICIDNREHAETGGQKSHTARRTNLALLAKGAGIDSVLTVDVSEQLDEAAKFLINTPAPRFVWVRVMAGPPSLYKRDLHYDECRLRFKTAYLDRKNKREIH